MLCLACEFAFKSSYEGCYRFFFETEFSLLMILQLLTLGLSYTKAFKTRFQPPVHLKDMVTR
ncbi:MAG: hypothetical protein A2107_12520 [Verrucomicrobia bacterium GWF2_62_7]|nr:MAG: hypothetical protein A2107_12520 [Verrucomicrobia bacterium GWF2_62_7]